MKDFKKNKNYCGLSIFILIFLIFSLILSFNYLLAATPADQLKALGGKAGYDTSTNTEEGVAAIIGKIIFAILSILGVIFLILIIYGGFMWMTARGNEQQLEKAKNIIINAVIGLAIILTSYTVTWFVMNALGESTGAIYP